MSKRIKHILIWSILIIIFWILLCPPILVRNVLPPHFFGFREIHSQNITICFKNKDPRAPFLKIDLLMKEAELFHNLRFKRPIRFYIFDSHQEFTKFSRLKKGVMGTGYNRIYVSPKALQQPDLILEKFINHELSHTLLFQNMSHIRRLFYPSWLIEGVAVYYSKQPGFAGYPNKEEVISLVKKGNFIYPPDYRKRFSPPKRSIKNIHLKHKHRYLYSLFGTIVDDLIQSYGHERFLSFLHKTLNSRSMKNVFKESFDINFDDYIQTIEKGL